MNLSRFRAISLSLVSLVATAAYAVEQLPEKEEDIPVEFVPRLDDMVKIGLRHVSQGPKVKFGNLGVIPQILGTSSDPSDTTTKIYSNGAIYRDAFNSYETGSDGKQLVAGTSITTANWISQVNANGTVTVFTPISTLQTQTNADGSISYVKNADGTYVPVTTPTLITNPDGSTTTFDNPVLSWASTNQYLSYNPNQTRSWSVANPSQIDPMNKTVSMSTFGAGTAGATAEATSSPSSGFDLTWERRLGQRGRFEWGISGGLSLASINAKVSNVIEANLQVATDTYQMIDTGFNSALLALAKANGSNLNSDGTAIIATTQPGNAQGLPLLGLGFNGTGTPLAQLVTTTNADGTTTTAPSGMVSGGDQSTVTPLNTTPASITSTFAENAGAVLIQGTWQIKGAYYNTRLGPTFRYRFNDRWAISGGAGLSVTWVGTVFKVDEVITERVDGQPLGFDASALHVQVQNNTHKFVPGYYGNLNAEYWVTERTGFYFGLNYEQVGHYYQTPLSGRTATIQLGKTSGWQLGIMTRF